MKRLAMAVLVGILSSAALCAYAIGQTEAPVSPNTVQDLLIKSEVETAVSMLQAIQAKHRQGEMTLKKAKELGAELLRELRYGADGYFWADTTEGVNVVLYSRKDVEGRKRLDDRDVNGKYYIKEFIAKAIAGGGYVEYWFPKKGQTTAQPKRSYVLLFEPFGWVVGSGYYCPVAADEAKSSALSRALAQVKLFAGLTDTERDALRSAAALRHVKAGERIIEQETTLDRMFIILDGQAEVRVNGKHIVTLSGQSLVGELEFLDALPASADVLVLQETDVIEINHAALTGLMEKQPRLGYVLMTEFAEIEAQRLRAMNMK
jgi:hypothetical protein